MRLKNISKNLTAKLTVNRINRLFRLKRFGSVRLIGFGYILPTPSGGDSFPHQLTVDLFSPSDEQLAISGRGARVRDAPVCVEGWIGKHTLWPVGWYRYLRKKGTSLNKRKSTNFELQPVSRKPIFPSFNFD